MSSKADVTRRLLDLMQVFIADAVLTNERIARSLGLSVVDLQAFGVLVRAGRPLTAGELSQRTELPTSTTTRVIDRLEREGFLQRAADPADRRRVVLHPRPDAFERFASGEQGDPYADVTAQVERAHEQFTVAELETVARYFEAVSAAATPPRP
ncbi:MarR family winged helix-turn-helix transcriptional regulator [Microbacterium sp. XT11]|uniref:MarR family winged helix-turn-helix transcriptional regulator n=1 Tax=Microbacterium sp. XT11 TaxID=367477 RepID=UPI000742E346|nr:MarR family transcriptional regulator [Microbacterium sp. XT11]ALX66107.1 putative MarR family transcriptional regulator [Microbacterium sp. XT11]